MARRLAGTPLDFGALRTELAVPGEFSSAAQADAVAAIESVTPDALGAAGYADRTDLPLITVDPPGSKDLDQAVHIAADGDGYLVSYAIADVAAFVRPGSTLDDETRARGETFYFPDARVPLHPTALSEGAASLLPDQIRPAALWQIRLDGVGQPTDVVIERALVRSTAQWDYAGLQNATDEGHPPEATKALLTVGQLRQALSRQRHAIALELPEQDVVAQDSSWSVVYRAPLPIEEANAEISLLTGACAARLMIDAGIGLLRTLPPPSARTVAALRAIAPALGVDWPDGTPPGDVLASIDPANPKHAAFAEHAASLLRGAGYLAFDGSVPREHEHAGLAMPYAHVTAPLRRLVDRFGTEVCLAVHQKQDVPDWVRAALPELPKQMDKADRLAHACDRAVVDAAEAFLLQDRIGDTFAAIVLDSDEKSSAIAIDEPAIRARCAAPNLTLGERIQVQLTAADVATRTVRFSLVI